MAMSKTGEPLLIHYVVIRDVLRAALSQPMNKDHCPTCDSPKPNLHPAIQFEGEVSPCADAFHHQVTAENTPAKISEMQRLLERPRPATERKKT